MDLRRLKYWGCKDPDDPDDQGDPVGRRVMDQQSVRLKIGVIRTVSRVRLC